MEILVWVVIGALALSWALAAAFARRYPEHRIIAVGLGATFGAELGRAALVMWVLPSPRPDPYTSHALILAAGADAGLNIVWPAVVAAVALRVLAQRPWWPAAAAWVLATVAIGAAYPVTRGDVLRRCYLGADLAGSFVAVASLGSHVLRALRGTFPRLAPQASFTIWIAAIFVLTHFVGILVGPHFFGLFGSAWILSLATNLAAFTIIAGLQAYAIGKGAP